MSNFKKCPYSNEECIHELYSLSLGIPRFSSCNTCSVIPRHKSDFEVIAELEKKNTDLEKENAELKEKLGDVQMQKAGEKSDLVWKLKKANEQKSEQLTKAKEIIRKYYKYNPSCEYSYDDIDKQAELFLKGCKESD